MKLLGCIILKGKRMLTPKERIVVPIPGQAYSPDAASALHSGPITVDAARFRVVVSGETLSLTRMEFDLLYYLMRNSDRVVAQAELLEKVARVSHRSQGWLRVHVLNLRRKLGAASSLIQTVHGRGLWFDESQAPIHRRKSHCQ
jgi:DNA-binding response OmpR family regulator